MRVHWLQHVEFEGLGTIAEWLVRHDHQISSTRLWAGERLPEPGEIDLLIIMGGPMGVDEEERYPWLRQEKRFIESVARREAGILGICLGAQLVAQVLGGSVKPNRYKEIGWFEIARVDDVQHQAAHLLAERMVVFHWHGDTFTIPPGGELLWSSEGCRNQGFVVNDRIIGLQFHLEMTEPGVRSLIKHCGAELIDDRWIQSEPLIMQGVSACKLNNTAMSQILDYLEAQLNGSGA